MKYRIEADMVDGSFYESLAGSPFHLMRIVWALVQHNAQRITISIVWAVPKGRRNR